MVNSNSSETTKRRKKRQSINFKTPRERRKAKHVAESSKVDLVEGTSGDSDQSISSRASTKGDGSILTFEKSSKDLGNSRRKNSSSTKSVAKGLATETEKTKSSTKKSSEPSSSRIGTRSDGSVSILGNSSKDLGNNNKKSSSSTRSVAKTSGAQSKRKEQSGKRPLESDSGSNKQGGKKRSKDSHLNTSKKAKTSQEVNHESFSSKTQRTSSVDSRIRTRQRKNPHIPDRIKDMKVTKKAYGKWKPLSKSTKEFTEQILKSVVLNFLADTKMKENEKAAECLMVLRDRVLERLPSLKAPYTQGDYRTMESQNKRSEEVLLEKSGEINLLDKKLAEEQRLLDIESAKVIEFEKKLELCKKELAILDNEKVHPLIREAKNVLDLPELPEQFREEDELMSTESTAEEVNLSQTLIQLRNKVTSIGLTTWMKRLATVTENLE